jgi:hypothetical protein
LIISADDLVFAVPWWLFLSLLFLLGDTSKALRMAAEEAKYHPVWMMELDAHLVIASIPLDILIGVLSSLGPLGEYRRYPKSLASVIFLRAVLTIISFVIFTVILTLLIRTYVYWLYLSLAYQEDPTFHHVDPEEAGGWGPELEIHVRNIGLFLALATRLVLYIVFLLWLRSISISEDALHGAEVKHAMHKALECVGTPSGVDFQKVLAGVMLQVCDITMLDYFTPSDLMFGLLLLQAKQKQSFIGTDPDEEYEVA